MSVVGRIVALLACLSASVLTGWTRAGKDRVEAAPAMPQVHAVLPLGLEENRGQAPPAIKYLAHLPGYTIYLTLTGAILQPVPAMRRASPSLNALWSLRSTEQQPHTISPGTVEATRLQYLSANSHPQIAREQMLPSKVNYLVGNNPRRWRVGIRMYAGITFRNIYPHIDLRYTTQGGTIEYAWIVHPGGNVRRIRMGIRGPVSRPLLQSGRFVLRTDGGSMIQSRPTPYQVRGQHKHWLSGHFTVDRSAQSLGFAVSRYDRSRTLVIDPTVTFATYLGGRGDDWANGVTVDRQGSSYIVGTTASANFPTKNPVDGAISGKACDNIGTPAACTDVFVAKLDPSGRHLLYATYLGGSDDDEGNGIAVDSQGRAVVTGTTPSRNFPVFDAIQKTFGGGTLFGDAFVTELSPDGSKLVFSTYLGGKSEDTGMAVALDRHGAILVAGSTHSTGFPTHKAYQATLRPGTCVYSARVTLRCSDAYITKLAPDGTAIDFSTYFGGRGAGSSSGDDEIEGVAVDGSGNAYVTGVSTASSFPTTARAFDRKAGGLSKSFVAKFRAGGKLGFSTFITGESISEQLAGTELGEEGLGIALDAHGDAFVTGVTASDKFPVTAGAFQRHFGGALDAFVVAVNSGGTGLLYGTYLGGNTEDMGTAIAVDKAGHAYVTGATISDDFPTAHAPQPALSQSGDGSVGAPADAFVTEMGVRGRRLVYSTFLGGTDRDEADAVAVDSAGNAYVAGNTISVDLPTSNAFQPRMGGGLTDAFVAKIQK